MLVDRPLTASESVRLKQRVLWYEAEVLAVHPSNPVCASGLTRSQAVALLDGSTPEWTSLIPAGSWPNEFVPTVRGYRPPATRSGYLEPFFGVATYGSELRPTSASSARAAITGDVHAFAPLRYSDVRGRTGVCAVAIDGIRPDQSILEVLDTLIQTELVSQEMSRLGLDVTQLVEADDAPELAAALREAPDAGR